MKWFKRLIRGQKKKARPAAKRQSETVYGRQPDQATGRKFGPASRVKLEEIHLLSTWSEIAANISSDALQAYMDQVERHVRSIVSQRPGACELLIQITLQTAGAPVVRTIPKGEADPAIMQHICDELEAMATVNTKTMPVSFQMQFIVTR